MPQGVNIAPDDEVKPSRKTGVKSPCSVALRAATAGNIQRKLYPLILADGLRRQSIQITGDSLAPSVGQQIERTALILTSSLDRVYDTAQSAKTILVSKGLHLRANGLIRLPLEQDSRIPVDVTQQGHDREGENCKIERRKAKR
ncbi:MAG: hypothetical protein KDK89_20620 [Alphaproteobacteria bacterium]|nr:hypothetical protein [Alphaproteobacteria bacterium]